ncbi:hypothetical protein P8907_19985 [Bacillus atrophaeus]|uniref:hypothetical protein n=1 Tax=Bacillus atrophaeus TaxID=1452 RepID=UPI0022824D85|nr:hypothetical protein [Bacillus atrophaeus]MCY8810705.1 hypothetical protein [Bacillus atrophaeus]MCY8907857.1 hypothetical protein [Bacillus atrophaeus]MEC0837863.1 hypothetical protein [Bacillus atrophaeus]MEC0847764.1 hypothetical protein [Bacillus atrophaeus]MEC0849983.1 hypothetical protein [Bacillus atrophaeus]
MEFIESVKEQLAASKLRQLTKFIRKEFPFKGQSHIEQLKKYEALKQLSDNDLSSGIARMTLIESSFDHSKFAALFVVILTLFFSALKIIFVDDKHPLGSGVYLLFTMFSVLILLIAVGLDKRDMTTATYFKTLLERAKTDKEKKGTPSPSNHELNDNQIVVNIRTWQFWIKDFYKQANNLDEILLNWSDYEIASYITYYFGYWTTKSKKAELQRIRGLTFDIIVLGIARMKEIEESNDNSKIIPGFSAGLVLICTQASILYRNMNSPLPGAVCAVFVAFIVYILLIKGIRNGSNLRSRAAKYRSLLEQVASEKEKENK